jgi:hypothetical protein
MKIQDSLDAAIRNIEMKHQQKQQAFHQSSSPTPSQDPNRVSSPDNVDDEDYMDILKNLSFNIGTHDQGKSSVRSELAQMEEEQLRTRRGAALKEKKLQQKEEDEEEDDTVGKITSEELDELVLLRQQDPQKWTAEALAAKFSTRVELLEKIFQFVVFPDYTKDEKGNVFVKSNSSSTNINNNEQKQSVSNTTK